MIKYTSTVTARGQVTIPSELRRTMGIKPKDRVALEVVEGGIRISPSGSGVMDGYASEWGDRRQAVEDLLSMEVSIGTWEEAKDAIAKGKLNRLEAD